MSLTTYVIVAFGSLIIGAALMLLGGRWLWRIAGVGLVGLGLVMLYLLVRGAGGLFLM